MSQAIVSKFAHALGRKPKICLVKQAVYKDLYNCPAGQSAKDIFQSSNMRSGPIGLLTQFDCDFRIVKVDPAIECQIWKQKVDYCKHGDTADFLALESREFAQLDGAKRRHSDFMTAVDAVDWGAYDMVISYDIAVPARVCKIFPSILWAYYITEGCMPEFRESLVRPVEGYRASFNHHFRDDRDLSLPLYGVLSKSHSLEFPYFLQYFGCFAELLNIAAPDGERSGCILDSRAKNILSDEQYGRLERFGPVRKVSGHISNIATDLLRSKYYIRFGNKPVMGNSSIEAIAGGALFIGSAHGIKNRSLIPRENCVRTQEFGNEQFDEVITMLEGLETNEETMTRQRETQRRLLDRLCYQRPLEHLFGIFQNHLEERN